jgi:fluoroacetyl-CoA thioesterase
MPKVLATGFMIGLIEWACIKAITPYLDWPEEQTVGTHVNVSHTAPTPPGLEVTVRVKLVEGEGRRLIFEVEAHDGIESIGKGTHERFIISKKRFDEKVSNKVGKNTDI